ncbi:MAG: SDR family NAD(P)-dependent oxidoreductase [Fimbriiglobus sp.]
MTNTPDVPALPLDLAIVGMGCLFPKADRLGGYWANIKNAIDGITEIPTQTHWNPKDYFNPDPKAPDMTYAQRGGFLSAIDFNPLEFGIAPRDIEATDTTQLLGLVAAKQALKDSGVVFTPGSPKSVERSKVSVLLGVTGTLELVIPLGARLGHPKWRQAMLDAGIPEEAADDAVARISESYVPWQENSFPGLLGNVVAGRIANRLDLHGTNCVVDAACASSLSAVHLAGMELATGKADVVVTGGADTFNDIFMYMCFSKTPALSKSGNSRPFDAEGDGTILGEGLGMVVLKRLKDAIAAGDQVYAVIKSIGTSSDGKGNAIYAPSAEGQKRCLQDAYKRAGVSPDTIELVEAHGTGTRVGDSVEASALADIYGAVNTTKAKPWCALGSVKSQVGHTKAAAGAAGLIKAAMALHFKVLPPTMKVTMPVEPLMRADSPFYVNTQMRPWLARTEHPRRAALSAFGFGGSNFHAVLEEYQPQKTSPDWDGHVEILALSGNKSTLLSKLDQLSEATTWAKFARHAEASRQSFNPSAPMRLLLVAHQTKTDLPKLLSSAKSKLAAQTTGAWQTPDGAYFGEGAPAGALAVLFPGQGSQTVGMLRELACTFPEMLDTLEAMNAGKLPRISDAIYPPTSFANDAKTQQDDTLRSTDVAQPAIGAVSYGAWKVLSERFGVRASAFAGHSYGELTALLAGGRLTPAEFVEFSRLRGSLMAAQKQKSGDAGSMLAVMDKLDRVKAILTNENLDLTIANINSPTQIVLSGSKLNIENAILAFQSLSVRCTRLPVAAAFHSSFVSDAAMPFVKALGAANFTPSAIPVFANTTAQPYPTDAVASRTLLGEQLAKPVQFVGQIEAMIQAGVTTLIEVGPGSVLTRLVEAILGDHDVKAEVFALDSSCGKRSGTHDLALLLARLAARGYACQISEWEAESLCRPGPEPTTAHTIPLTGANVVNKRTPRPPKPKLSLAGSTEPNGNHGSSSVNNLTGNLMAERGPQPGEPGSMPPAMSLLQQTLLAIQAQQAEASKLHKQFLDNQAQTQQMLAQMLAQQSAFLAPNLPNVGSTPQLLVETPAPKTAAPLVPPPVFTPPPRLTANIVPQPAPAPAPRPKTPEPVSLPTNTLTPVGKVLLDVVSEKTGYPVDMLNLEMSLDNDLGVDSIKRVEILSAIQEKLPHAPQVKSEHIGTLHTLQDIANFLDVNSNKATIAVEALPIISPVFTGPKSNGASAAKAAIAQTAFPKVPTDQVLSPGLGMPISMADLSGPASSASLSNYEAISKTLIGVVAEKTGYPPEMLSPEMSLDADLGVDSIKRVEILSAIQEKLPHAPQVKSEHIGTLHTLQDIARFLTGTSPASIHTTKIDVEALRQSPKSEDPNRFIPAIEPTLSELLAPKTEQIGTIRAAQVATDSVLLSKRRPMSDPVASASATIEEVANKLESWRNPIMTANIENVDRSILQVVDIDLASARPRLSFVEGSEFWIIAPADDPLAAETVAHLQDSKFVVKQFPWLDPDMVKPTGAPSGMILIAPYPIGNVSVNRLTLRWLQSVGPKLKQLARQGSTTLIASIARLDGEFGLGELTTNAEASHGGLAGIMKSARCEWPDINFKAMDIALGHATTNVQSAAASILDEVLMAGPIEVGIGAKHRCTLEPARTVRRATGGAPVLGPKDVILVTGGARGVTAEVAVSLAEAFRATMVLTGRTPLPSGPEPEWLANLRDESEMKKAISEHLGASASPKSVGEFFAKTLAQREVTNTLNRIQQTGSKALYFPVNVGNGRQLADMIHQVKMKHGPITALVHGAGVLADKRIEDLTVENFDLVYNTKVEGMKNLLDLLANQDLKAILLFSSTTARVGRPGQLAYAAANEVLNKMAQIEARKRPSTRVVSINWGPWDGGMVTPALRRVFEGEGIGLIPLQEGGIFAVQELSAAGKAVEVIALGKSVRPKGSMTASGSGSAILTTPQPVPGQGPNSVLVGSPELLVIYDRTVDIPSHPILASHVMESRAVLPMALHLEWLAHAALHGNPGLVFHGFNDLRVTQGVNVEEGGTTLLKAYAGKAVKQGGLFHVAVELRGKRRDGRDAIHSRAEIVLASALPKAPMPDSSPQVSPYPHPNEEIYRYFLFHGPDLQGIERVEGLSELAFIGQSYSAPNPMEWMKNPLRPQWVADPLALDTSFQMMILWSFAQHAAGSLPCFAGRYRQYRRSFPTGSIKIVIRITRDNGSFARADMDYIDGEGLIIAQLQDYECVIDRNLQQSFRRNQLPSASK